MVVLHMVLELQPRIPVLFLETGYHFPETLDYRDRIAAEWNLNLVIVEPEQTVAEQESQFGILNQTAPDRCCGLRKVEPLFRALGSYSTWVTGLRRQQSKSRANLQAARVLHAAHQATSSPSSARSPSGPRATSGNTPSSTTFRSCRSTNRATPPSVVLLVPACPSIPTIPARAAGPAANSSAASTCRPT